MTVRPYAIVLSRTGQLQVVRADYVHMLADVKGYANHKCAVRRAEQLNRELAVGRVRKDFGPGARP